MSKKVRAYVVAGVPSATFIYPEWVRHRDVSWLKENVRFVVIPRWVAKIIQKFSPPKYPNRGIV